jgi:hypothetical protein
VALSIFLLFSFFILPSVAIYFQANIKQLFSNKALQDQDPEINHPPSIMAHPLQPKINITSKKTIIFRAVAG